MVHQRAELYPFTVHYLYWLFYIFSYYHSSDEYGFENHYDPELHPRNIKTCFDS